MEKEPVPVSTMVAGELKALPALNGSTVCTKLLTTRLTMAVCGGDDER